MWRVWSSKQEWENERLEEVEGKMTEMENLDLKVHKQTNTNMCFLIVKKIKRIICIPDLVFISSPARQWRASYMTDR